MLYPFCYMITHVVPVERAVPARRGGFSLASWHNLFDVAAGLARSCSTRRSCRSARIAIILVVSTTAGYAFGILRYRAATVAFLLVVGAMMVPMQSIIVPEYINLVELLAASTTTTPRSSCTPRSARRSRRS